jgi:S-adenosyl-L-methionine hydrolase (adenosine-forming)
MPSKIGSNDIVMPKTNIPIITLLTDFGTQDTFVAEMKGQILSRLATAILVDISHAVPAYDIEKGAFMIHAVYSSYPKGTIHVVVVDPGVGGDRKPIIVKALGQYFVGPDNGLFTLIANMDKQYCAYEITVRAPISATFHGRDLFAPTAALIASNSSLNALGTPLSAIYLLKSLIAHKNKTHTWEGKVISCDRFGNLTTNIPGKVLLKMKNPCLKIGRRKITHFSKTFITAKENQIGAIINSQGFIEIILPGQSAQAKFAIQIGTRVFLSSNSQ